MFSYHPARAQRRSSLASNQQYSWSSSRETDDEHTSCVDSFFPIAVMAVTTKVSAQTSSILTCSGWRFGHRCRDNGIYHTRSMVTKCSESWIASDNINLIPTYKTYFMWLSIKQRPKGGGTRTKSSFNPKKKVFFVVRPLISERHRGRTSTTRTWCGLGEVIIELKG